MGRAMRWFKTLFGLKDGKGRKDTTKSSNRSRGGSAYPCHNPATIPPNITAAEATWLKSFDAETEKEQNKHAVANATVAATRRTSHGWGITLSGSITRNLAAVKIQTTFRGFLAKKALKALKGLVKLQALVRGFLVRKQANATLLRIEALIRAQSIVRAQKFQGHYQNYDNFGHNYGVRKVMGKCDDTRSEYKTTIHSRRISSSFNATKDLFVEKQMIAEADPAQPKSRSRMLNKSISNRSEDLYCPVHYKKPARISTPDGWNFHDTDWPLTGYECQFSTALSTPRFVNGPGRFANGTNGLATPTYSVCGVDVLRNNMADTQSFKAKQRSQSAPRQRPDIGPKKRVTLKDLMESRNSHSGARMERSCSQAQDAINFKNVVMGKLERSCDFASYGKYMF